MIRPHYVPLFQSISRSKKLRALPDHGCRVFYTWLLAHLDSHGRIEADAETLNVLVWPMLGETDEETERVLLALNAAGLIRLYDSGRKRYLCDVAWEEHAGSVGKPERRARSLFPDPPDQDQSGDCRTTPESSGPVLPRARVGSGISRIGSDEGVQGDSRYREPPERPSVIDTHLAMHPSLDTREIRTALEALDEHRVHRRKGRHSSQSIERLLHVWEANCAERGGSARFLAAINAALESGDCTPYDKADRTNGSAADTPTPRHLVPKSSGLLEMPRTKRGGS